MTQKVFINTYIRKLNLLAANFRYKLDELKELLFEIQNKKYYVLYYNCRSMRDFIKEYGLAEKIGVNISTIYTWIQVEKIKKIDNIGEEKAKEIGDTKIIKQYRKRNRYTDDDDNNELKEYEPREEKEYIPKEKPAVIDQNCNTKLYTCTFEVPRDRYREFEKDIVQLCIKYNIKMIKLK
jgi:hypothetical protein